nr:MAG TPA: hypothetical protein [Caudoviricetes sp.]
MAKFTYNYLISNTLCLWCNFADIPFSHKVVSCTTGVVRGKKTVHICSIILKLAA